MLIFTKYNFYNNLHFIGWKWLSTPCTVSNDPEPDGSTILGFSTSWNGDPPVSMSLIFICWSRLIIHRSLNRHDPSYQVYMKNYCLLKGNERIQFNSIQFDLYSAKTIQLSQCALQTPGPEPTLEGRIGYSTLFLCQKLQESQEIDLPLGHHTCSISILQTNLLSMHLTPDPCAPSQSSYPLPLTKIRLKKIGDKSNQG